MLARVIIFDPMKKILTFILLILAASAVFLPGCQKPGCTGNAGQVIVQERIITSFSNIQLRDNIDLVLVQGDTEKIEVTGPENILPNVQTILYGDSLVISNTTECRWLRSTDERIKVKVFFKTLDAFYYNGSGNVTNEDTLRLNTVRFISETGAGIIDLNVNLQYLNAVILKENASMIFHGQAATCDTYINARGILKLDELQTKRMYLIYSGLADTHVRVSDEIEAYVRYKGNVYCKGSPVVIKQEYFSSGRLIFVP